MSAWNVEGDTATPTAARSTDPCPTHPYGFEYTTDDWRTWLPTFARYRTVGAARRAAIEHAYERGYERRRYRLVLDFAPFIPAQQEDRN